MCGCSSKGKKKYINPRKPVKYKPPSLGPVKKGKINYG